MERRARRSRAAAQGYGDAATGTVGAGHVFVLRIDTAGGGLLSGNVYEKKGFAATVNALARFPNGGVAVGGHLRPPANFGGEDLIGPALPQPFVARYDGTGQHLWSTLFCSTSTASASSVAGIATDGDSAVLLVRFYKDLELGSQTFQATSDTALVDMPAP